VKEYTSKKEIIAAFWRETGASRRKIAHYSGRGKMYTTDTRCAFVDFIDYLCRDGAISPDMAQTITLGD